MKSEGVVFIILRKSFFVYSVSSVDFFSCLRQEIYHRNLDGIYTDGLGCASARNLWGKSCLRSCFARNISNYLGTKIFKQKS